MTLPKPKPTVDESLDVLLAETTHTCGRCRTPYGRSSLPCPNDPATPARRQAELRARLELEFGGKP